MKILIVDDEDCIRTLVQNLVSRNGNTVVTAADGLEGLAKAKEFGPDLIISDTNMPNKSGPEFLDAYLAENPEAKAVLMSGKGREDLREKYPSVMQYTFLRKPFTSSELKYAISEVCRETS